MVECAVTNASPLIFFSRGRHLELLEPVARRILVPEPVAAEIQARGNEDPTVRALQEHQWLEVRPAVAIPPLISAWGLGAGESSVIALAQQMPGTEALIDDSAGRKCALALGIPVRGTLGIVLLAKKQGLIPAARPVMEDLLKGGLYLSRSVLDRALAKVGE